MKNYISIGMYAQSGDGAEMELWHATIVLLVGIVDLKLLNTWHTKYQL